MTLVSVLGLVACPADAIELRAIVTSNPHGLRPAVVVRHPQLAARLGRRLPQEPVRGRPDRLRRSPDKQPPCACLITTANTMRRVGSATPASAVHPWPSTGSGSWTPKRARHHSHPPQTRTKPEAVCWSATEASWRAPMRASGGRRSLLQSPPDPERPHPGTPSGS